MAADGDWLRVKPAAGMGVEMNREKNTERRIGKYRLVRALGTGATARVYLARGEGAKEFCALKYSDSSELIRREAEILKRLKHNCFPRWIEDGEQAPGAWLAMEYIQGITLQQLMEQYRTGMPEQMALGIAMDVAAGLAYLHSFQPAYIYRDLKAANVMITGEGRARLVDLGAAVCQQERGDGLCRAGTYGYGAPEQFWEGSRVTPACDVYAMGKLLSFMLSGQDPGKPPYDTMGYCRRHQGIGREYKQLLGRCLQSDPQLRCPDAAFLLRDLSALRMGRRKIRSKIGRNKGSKVPYRYIKCIWRSDYERIF